MHGSAKPHLAGPVGTSRPAVRRPAHGRRTAGGTWSSFKAHGRPTGAGACFWASGRQIDARLRPTFFAISARETCRLKCISRMIRFSSVDIRRGCDVAMVALNSFAYTPAMQTHSWGQYVTKTMLPSTKISKMLSPHGHIRHVCYVISEPAHGKWTGHTQHIRPNA